MAERVGADGTGGSSGGRLYPRTQAKPATTRRCAARKLVERWHRSVFWRPERHQDGAGGDLVLHKRHHRSEPADAQRAGSAAAPGAACGGARALRRKLVASAMAGSLAARAGADGVGADARREACRGRDRDREEPTSPPPRSTTARARRSTRPATMPARSPTSRRPTTSSRRRTPSATSGSARTTSGTTRPPSTGTTSSSRTCPTSWPRRATRFASERARSRRCRARCTSTRPLRARR